MKKLILLSFLLLICFFGYCQTEDDKPLVIENIINLDSTYTKDILFNNIQIWFSRVFVSSKAVLDVQDKESGILAGNGSLKFKPKGIANECYAGYIEFSINFIIKDGRFKYILRDFYHNDNYEGVNNCQFGLIYTKNDYTGEKTHWSTTKNFDIKNYNFIHEEIELMAKNIDTLLKYEIANQKINTNNDW